MAYSNLHAAVYTLWWSVCVVAVYTLCVCGCYGIHLAFPHCDFLTHSVSVSDSDSASACQNFELFHILTKGLPNHNLLSLHKFLDNRGKWRAYVDRFRRLLNRLGRTPKKHTCSEVTVYFCLFERVIIETDVYDIITSRSRPRPRVGRTLQKHWLLPLFCCEKTTLWGY